MKKIQPLTLSLLCGLLLFAAWPVSPLTFLVFVGFIPLLWLELRCERRVHFFLYTYLAMLVWNTGTTWWTCNSTLPGGIAAILANSLLMSLPWLAFYNIKRRMGEKTGYFSLVIFWLVFEYIHMNWELSWPWLTLGNVFARHVTFVQWYEYTGTSGGSLWVLLVNLLIFRLLDKRKKYGRFDTAHLLVIGVCLALPVLLSVLIHPVYLQGASVLLDKDTSGASIVVVQPNIDPWDEKFAAGTEAAQIAHLIQLSESKIDTSTALVIWPETAIPPAINEDSILTNPFLSPIWAFLKKHPRLNLLTGMEGFRIYDAQHKPAYAQQIPGTEKYVESYNSAVLMDSNSFWIYHKSKFVPGAEKMPSFLHFMDSWFEKFGGTTSGYTGQADRTVLKTTNHSYAIAPSVCYESIYGEFMSKFVENGADLIAIITNDGWWGNTAGYRQHENYARLRAIETRRWIARSANTGISCFIDPAGDVLQAQPWNRASAIKQHIPSSTHKITFYTRYGDLISKIAIAIAFVLIILNIAVVLKKGRKNG